MIYAILAVLLIYTVFRIWGPKPDVSPAETKVLLENGGQLIDVRTTAEFRNGHIRGAISLPLERLPEGLKVPVPDKDTAILLYCASGIRSGRAKKLLRKAGYTSVFNAGAMSSLNR